MKLNWTTLRRGGISAAVIAIAVITVHWNGFTLPVWLAEIHSGRIISHGESRARIVALTFDDGPDPKYTPRVLSILNRYGVRATFFDQGRMIRKYPGLVADTVRHGNVVGNHTDTHPYIERLSPSAVDAQVTGCDDALMNSAGIRTNLFRPPRGAWNPTVYSCIVRRHKTMILWSVALEHGSTPRPQEMAARVLRLVRPGDIVLMHDGANYNRDTTLQALPLLLDGLKKNGYRCVTIPELMHLPADAVSARPSAAMQRGSQI